MFMQLYSHLVLAALLKPSTIEDESAYFLGSIIPDIRYYNGLKREQTHLSSSQIDAYLQQYPTLDAFICGYRLHCQIDELENKLIESIKQSKPFSWLGNRLKYTVVKMLIEFFYLRRYELSFVISNSVNDMLLDLGATPDEVTVYVGQINSFLAERTFAKGIEVFGTLGILKSANAQVYLDAANTMMKARLLHPLLFFLLSPHLQKFERQLKVLHKC